MVKSIGWWKNENQTTIKPSTNEKMITDQKTIDALKELNYTQVYQKGKLDGRKEVLKLFRQELIILLGEFDKTGLIIEKEDFEMVIKSVKQQLQARDKK